MREYSCSTGYLGAYPGYFHTSMVTLSGNAHNECIVLVQNLTGRNYFAGEQISHTFKAARERKRLILEIKNKVVDSIFSPAAGDLEFGLFRNYRSNTC